VRILPPIELPPGDVCTEGFDSSYVLGPGDVLTTVDASAATQDVPFTSTVTVIPDGTVSVYPVGTVQAAGLTLDQLTVEVNRRAQKYIVDPQIVIQLATPRPVNVYILGQVIQPGLYSLTAVSPTSGSISPASGGAAPTSISQSAPPLATPQSVTPTLLSALNKAGGIAETADICHIKIARNRGKQICYANLWKLIADGDTTQDVLLRPGDVITVPAGGVPPEPALAAINPLRQVRVWGSVQSPGLYSLGSRDDAFSIIAKAGGFTGTAVTSQVLLSRLNPDGTLTTTKIKIKKAIRTKNSLARQHVQPGDVLVASPSIIKTYAPYVVQRSLVFAFALLLVYANARLQNNNNNSGNFRPLF
jgi:polysaccharide export outer membrane protein